MQTYSAGQRIGGYTVSRVLPYPQVNGQYVELTHDATGARHVHINCPDDNNSFMVTFPTIPQDDTGVAHILEHIVLAGSEKYPVRDPFFSMIPRSLNTFMNAMTSSAWTTYPFSTRNEKDFYNLLDVYLDATFFPKIAKDSYLQEAWRFEFGDGQNPDTPLEYKGVVFNEMKGAMANVGSRMYRTVYKGVFPDITYGNNSGGEPTAIPNLTWQQLKDFHATHYHPSNAYFYTYGSFPLEKTLAQIEKNALSKFNRLERDWSVPDQPRFTAPRRIEATYGIAPTDPVEKKAQVAVSWLTAPITDSFELLALRVLERVLLANAASPLRKALIESNIGSALADGTGLNDDPREAVFTAGLKDVNPEDAEHIENLILETLQTLVEGGVDKEMVDAAIHRFEIENREVSNAGFPFAFKPAFMMLGAYLYGGDPYRSLQFDEDIARLERERGSGRFFESLIQKHLLENPHRVTTILKPDAELIAKSEADERAKLEQIKQTLAPERVSEILADAKMLQSLQDGEQDLSVLPTLELTDVPMTFEDVAHRVVTVRGATVGLFPQPTNGLAYLDFNTDFSGLPEHLKDLLPVFNFVFTKMGAGKSSYLEMAGRIEASTGGIGASAGTRVAPDNLEQFRQGFNVSTKTLYRNLDATFSILHDFLTALTFDRQHLKNLLGMYRTGLESRVIGAGHIYAWGLAESQLTSVGVLKERMGGVSHVRLAKRLSGLDDADLDALIADLGMIRDHLFRAGGMRICVTAEDKELEGLQTRIEALLAALPSDAPSSRAPEYTPAPAHPQARSAAVPVAFDAEVFKTVPYTHADAPVLMALGEYLRARYLHKEIREKGGAYGGFAAVQREEGIFALLSYRDPHIKRTFEVFDGVAAFLEQPIDADALKEAILAACADVDPLSSPDTKGRSRFYNDLLGYTLERRAEFKRRLLQVTAEDLRRVASTYLKDGARAVVSSEEKIAEANAAMGGVFAVEAV
jgi:Zn-dependent M16 (insulinase) family peptidase